MKKPKCGKYSAQIITGLSIFAAATVSAVDFEATVTNSEFPDNPGPTVSNSDLLQTAFESVTDTGLADLDGTTEGEPSLRNGLWDNNGQSRGAAGVDNDDTAEYTLNLTASPGGYTITGVDLYSNWGTGQGRDEIRVRVSFALVGTPDVFDQVLVNTSGEPNLFVYNPPTQTQGKMSLSGFSIAGVAAIRFEWPFMQENNGVGYSEIDVFGTSTGNDVDPPTLSGTDPAPAAVNVPTNTNLTFTFNEDIQAGSGIIDLRTTNPDAVVESFDVTSLPPEAFNGRDLIINPSNPLTPGVEYYVVIPAGAVDDTSGNDFAGIPAFPDAEAFIFTTDDTPPALTGTEALLNGLPTSNLTIEFNEAIQVGVGDITLHAAAGEVLQTFDVTSDEVTVDGDTVMVDITDLEFDTAYYVNFPEGTVTDLSGNPAAAITDSTTFSFSSVATTLIHFWGFEGDGTDSAGTHDGTLEGGAMIGEGLFGQAFEAVNGDFLNVNRSSLPATNFTMSCWVNVNDLTGIRHVAGTRRGTNLGARLVVEGGIPRVHLRSETNVILIGPNQLVAQEWTHLAFSVDETNGLTLYVNGSPVATDATGVGHAVTDNFLVGRRPDVVGDSFVGRIDELRIYAEVLSAAQIAELATQPGEREIPLLLEIAQSGGNLDFDWNSIPGMQYDLVSATDFSAPISSWAIYDDGVNPPYEDIPSDGIFTSLNGVLKIGPTRFFALVEEEMPAPLSEDFEAGLPEDWTVTDNGAGTAWEVGSPSFAGPLAAANGSNCAATNIADNYTSDALATLTSPAFAAPAGGATLSFQQYIDTESDSASPDFGTVRILDADNADAEIVDGLFPITAIDGIELGWSAESFALPAAALGRNIKIQFQFESNSSSNWAGFYIDDVQVTP